MPTDLHTRIESSLEKLEAAIAEHIPDIYGDAHFEDTMLAEVPVLAADIRELLAGCGG